MFGGGAIIGLNATDSRHFYHQVWRFHNAGSRAIHNTWIAPTAAQNQLLRHEENYPMLLEGFCRDIPIVELPNTKGYIANRGETWWYTRRNAQGCPLGDPGFPASNESVLLASGLNCPAPKHCLPPQWLTQLEQVFVGNVRHLTKDDLFERDVCDILPAERRGDQILPYTYFRFGVQVDFLIDHGHLVSGHDIMLEIGAGWAGLAAIVKNKYPGTRYIIVDIPTSMPIQMSHLHHLGHTHIHALSDSATTSDVEQLLCCTRLDVLFVKPHQLPLLPNRSVDVAVNFDSFVEMPAETIKYYVSQLGRISNALFSVNRQMQNFPALREAVTSLTRRGAGGLQLAHTGEQVAHPSGHGYTHAIGMAGGYVQHYAVRPHGKSIGGDGGHGGGAGALSARSQTRSSSGATLAGNHRERHRAFLQLSMFLEDEVHPILTKEKQAKLDELLMAMQ